MLLKAHCDMRKQEQKNYIIARELDIPAHMAFNDIKSLPHHCCHSKTGLIFIFLPCQQHFLFITHFNKNHEQEIFNSI